MDSPNPEKIRIPLLQRLTDGDGWASTRVWKAGIGTKENANFIIELLASLKIYSFPCNTGVEIRRKHDLKRAAELPLFRYSRGRLARIRQLNDMIECQNRSSIEGDEARYILQLREKDLPYGRISEILWDEYEVSRRPSTICAFVNRIRNEEGHNIQ
ncbi:MAG: hypothetical protein KGY80_08380 [Candidatus Thorarchaeota archaeon]|nr:hypothetical protein [Candidatus Thorarchaeota archaeon]